MSKIKFSVIIPTCDRPLLLEETLQSVLSQSFSSYEIIIIDNGNRQIDAKIFARNERVRYIRALPLFGVAQARNMGICLARGDYVAFLDDDDIWDKDYLKEVVSIIDTTGASIVLGSLKTLETGKIMRSKSEPIKSLERFKIELLRGNPGALGSNTVVRRKVILKSSGYDPILTPSEDKALVLDLLSNSKIKVLRAEKAFVYYRKVIEGERLSDFSKRAKGKIRFLVKYWKIMTFPTRLIVFLDYIRLKIKKTIGIDYIRKSQELPKKWGTR